jgi:hypothetical protein
VVEIVRSILFQPDILNEIFLNKDNKKIDEKVFILNISDNKSEEYGNPVVSFQSYFEFFEKPFDGDENLYEDDTIINYDWFLYKGIDKVSTQMEIKNDVILVEIRNFQTIMTGYVYGMADSKLKTLIQLNENCYKIEKYCYLGIDFGSLKKFFFENRQIQNTRKTKKLKPKSKIISKTKLISSTKSK